ncbi:putative isopenicillin N synthetase [Teratosphaeria nubilosa]|uniref:Putative isopenicillin N synthetase n=1 Tax=Teratosphaeria nubilosa TaxID=161662 RepID=A0A6G1LHA3_9PEZI|nr:putative isopenicillin N synthetase [Teratosphaeria nubilosa]
MEFTSFSGRKRTLAGDTARKASFDEIPLISLAAPLDEIVAALQDACTRVGFMYIQDHGVPQAVIDQAFATAKAFFDQPLEAKSEIHYKKSSILRGYEPIAEVTTDETRSKDLNEAFNCGYEPDLDPSSSSGGDWSIIKSAMQGANVWPALLGFKESVASYYSEMLKLARKLVKIFAVVLGLPFSHFDEVFTHPGAMLRLLKYPAQDPMKPDALGVGAHTDIECFTILCQDTQPALQVLNTDGQWIEVPPIPGTFVVNIGDMLARWSNDTFISTVHRVLNITGEERYSIPFFFGPNYDTVLAPLKTCVAEGSVAQYEPVVAGDYVYQRLARSRLGKQASEVKLQQTAAAA